MMDWINMLLHPVTAGVAIGMIAGSYLTIVFMFRRKVSSSMRVGK